MADVIGTGEIVTLLSVREDLNITLNTDDMKLDRLMETARKFIEGYVGPLDDFGTAEAVPEPIRQAMRLYVGHLYDNGADVPPDGIFMLINPYRNWAF